MKFILGVLVGVTVFYIAHNTFCVLGKCMTCILGKCLTY